MTYLSDVSDVTGSRKHLDDVRSEWVSYPIYIGYEAGYLKGSQVRLEVDDIFLLEIEKM